MHWNFCNYIIFFFFDVNRVSRNYSFPFVNFFYEFIDTAFELKNFFFWIFKTFIAENNYNTRVQKSKLAKTIAEYIKIISCCFCKNWFISLPADCCTMLVFRNITNNFYFSFWNTSFIFLLIYMTVTFYSCFHPVWQSINAGNTNTMQTAGNFIRTLVEFTAGMKTSQNQFKCTYFFGRVDINWNTASVIYNAYNVIAFKCNCNCITKACHCFIDWVIYCFINKMMKSTWTCWTNIHTRSLTNCFESLQNLYVTCTVFCWHYFFLLLI